MVTQTYPESRSFGPASRLLCELSGGLGGGRRARKARGSDRPPGPCGLPPLPLPLRPDRPHRLLPDERQGRREAGVRADRLYGVEARPQLAVLEQRVDDPVAVDAENGEQLVVYPASLEVVT
jgi:hypothetical protein